MAEIVQGSFLPHLHIYLLTYLSLGFVFMGYNLFFIILFLRLSQMSLSSDVFKCSYADLLFCPPENAAGHAGVHSLPQPGGKNQTAEAPPAGGGHHPGQVCGCQQVRLRPSDNQDRPSECLMHIHRGSSGRRGRGVPRAAPWWVPFVVK